MTWTFVFQLILLACVATLLLVAVAGAFRTPIRARPGDINGPPGAKGDTGESGRAGPMGPPGPPCQGPCCRAEKGTPPW